MKEKKVAGLLVQLQLYGELCTPNKRGEARGIMESYIGGGKWKGVGWWWW